MTQKILSKTRPARLVSFLFLCTLLISACAREEPRDVYRFAGQTMGTEYNVTLVGNPGERITIDQSSLQAAIDGELALINRYMSTYIPDSELMEFNRAPIGVWTDISRPMADVLAISQHISLASEGAFDVTVGPLVNVWGFGPEHSVDRAPTPEQLNEIKKRVGYQHLELDAQRARKAADIFVDLSAVAKGYGVDWISVFLEGKGFQNHLVEIGGEIRVRGLNPRGAPWRIAIEQPSLLNREARKIIELVDVSMATSGDYRNYFERDGLRYSHTIDPVTGYPITHNLVSVTVLADSTAEADAWATALTVLGPEAGMALAELEQLAVYMIIKEDEGYSDRYSSAFEPYR